MTKKRRKEEGDPSSSGRGITRRGMLGAMAAGAAMGATGGWYWHHSEKLQRSATFVARAERYGGELVDIIRRGLTELAIGAREIKGRRVVLKPNLVEPHVGAEHINTHPIMIRAAAEVFRGLGASEVLVAEGPGHCRDTELVLEQSGFRTMLRDERLRFVDLNVDDVIETHNRGGLTDLGSLYLPATLAADHVLVSMPKLKTHHWTGVTLAMKNLFGIMPGSVYGWPKNVLHRQGIVRSILDVNATRPVQLAIVDGIVGMEGDGPIMGTAKRANLLVMGVNATAVDATSARLMGFEPENIPFLRGASGRLGPIAARNIEQRGESTSALVQRFELLDHPGFARFRPGSG